MSWYYLLRRQDRKSFDAEGARRLISDCLDLNGAIRWTTGGHFDHFIAERQPITFTLSKSCVSLRTPGPTDEVRSVLRRLSAAGISVIDEQSGDPVND